MAENETQNLCESCRFGFDNWCRGRDCSDCPRNLPGAWCMCTITKEGESCKDYEKYTGESVLPAADVVEVVRCKDCIYSKEYNYLEDKGMCMCERKIVRHGIYKNPIMLKVSKNDFCSGGERKQQYDQ